MHPANHYLHFTDLDSSVNKPNRSILLMSSRGEVVWFDAYFPPSPAHGGDGNTNVNTPGAPARICNPGYRM